MALYFSLVFLISYHNVAALLLKCNLLLIESFVALHQVLEYLDV
jgi:hypothetical protein